MVSMKKLLKVAGAACAATGVVALSGLVASGAAVGAVVEGFKSAGDTIKKMLSDEPKTETAAAKTEDPVLKTIDTEKQEVSAN